ncbi:MAG TPA: adenylate/guanylate cyclase domain-containing protein [Thermoanaerobaculia bacterium]|nr:adenylate/guanylate cyclase domain-containing protein [Thermoanaerobaculia bacterium]
MNRKLFRGALAGILCTLAVAAISIRNETYFGTEWLLRDFTSEHLAARRPPDPRIVIAAIGEKTTRLLAEAYGRPQSYSRELYAIAIEELRRAGASVVAFDILFAEENLNDPEGDRHFAAALLTMPTVLGADARALPHPMFRTAGGIGTMGIASSELSANVHSYLLLDRGTPSLALQTWRLATSAPREASWRPALNGGDLRVGRHTIPTDGQGNLTIRWRGAKRSRTELSYKVVDFEKLIIAATADQPPEKLRAFEEQFHNKIVLIGFTAAGLLDLRATPLSPTSAGVEIHANALDNLMNGDFDVVVNRWLVFPAIALLAALLGLALESIRRQVAAGVTAIAFIVAALAIIYASAHAGWILPAFGTIASLALTYVVITVINFVAEQRQTAVLRTTFGRYVSPQILDHILAHPERVQLGGERRDLTILFSDIRGFTSISEASEPEQVVEMLNEYLTRMVEILLDHGGTLDKFIGDAVMGFWNAPAADPDHPHHAVACAIEMIRETARIRERWTAEGKAAIRIGIGINTGEAVVGNIGAEKVFGYTVIGDAVNLASRLEGKNKDYGTEIIISQFTQERIAGAFETVYLDEVKVKGKEKAVKIYEVRCQ